MTFRGFMRDSRSLFSLLIKSHRIAHKPVAACEQNGWIGGRSVSIQSIRGNYIIVTVSKRAYFDSRTNLIWGEQWVEQGEPNSTGHMNQAATNYRNMLAAHQCWHSKNDRWSQKGSTQLECASIAFRAHVVIHSVNDSSRLGKFF